MAIYLLPMIGTGVDHDPRRPAYIATDAPNTDYSLMDYGPEPVCLVFMNTSLTQDIALKLHTDIFALPSDIDQTIGAQLILVQNALSAFNIPEDWVQAGFTYRQVLRVVALTFQFMQRFSAFQSVSLFINGVTLSTRFNQLPADVRTALQATATDLGFDTSGISGTTTLRVIMKNLADQSNIVEVFLGDQVL